MSSHCHEVNVASFQQKQHSQINPYAEFKVSSKGTQPQPGMKVGFSNNLRQARRRVTKFLLAGFGQPFESPREMGSLINLQNATRLPAFWSARIASRSLWALRSTSSGVTP